MIGRHDNQMGNAGDGSKGVRCCTRRQLTRHVLMQTRARRAPCSRRSSARRLDLWEIE